MWLLNYDYYDIYALFICVRHCPDRPDIIPPIEELAEYIETPQTANGGDTNTVRKIFRKYLREDEEEGLLKWVFTENVYTGGIRIIKDGIYNKIISACLRELAAALREGRERAKEAAYAMHNIPDILQEYEDKAEIWDYVNEYRSIYNKSFLETELKELKNYETERKTERKKAAKKNGNRGLFGNKIKIF